MEIILIIIAIILVAYLIKKRNEFEKLRRRVKQEGSDIGIYIAKRTACLNDAMNIARISYSHEVEGISALTAKDQLDQLAFLGQKYPALQSIEGYNDIVRRAFSLNENIAASRALLNGNIREYNDAITAFPGLIVAAIFRYRPETFVDEENIEENKKLDKSEVDFSKM